MPKVASKKAPTRSSSTRTPSGQSEPDLRADAPPNQDRYGWSERYPPEAGRAEAGRIDDGSSSDYLDPVLLAALSVLESRVNLLVSRRREVDPDPEDQFRGLYVSEEQVDELLGRPFGARASASAFAQRSLSEDLEAALAGLGHDGDPDLLHDGHRSRLASMAARLDLDDLDVQLMVAALAPDLDSRFERLYGYLNDDVTRRRASVALALELSGGSLLDQSARSRLLEGSRLLTSGLLIVEDADRPFLTRSLRVPDRVTAHLLGDDRMDPALADLEEPFVVLELPGAEELASGLASGSGLAYLRERPGAATRSFVAAALMKAGVGILSLALDRVDRSTDPLVVAELAGREAGIVGCGVLAGPVEAMEHFGPRAIRAFAELNAPVVLFGRTAWDPSWSSRIPYLLDAPMVPAELRDEVVTKTLADAPGGSSIDPSKVLAQFRLSPEQVFRATLAARSMAGAEERPVSPEDLQAGARAQNSAGLERLARRIVPDVGWEDLVLPQNVVRQLREVAARARHRHSVMGEWGMRRGGGRGRGVVALFAGESGTGKTMSAEVIAGDLGIDLYTVNLATVVDKYVGETEKNLERIFGEADGVNGVLLFDEADALFGKRSEVSDAHDRYANIEVAYLLQRIESFDGLAILATNLRANVDEAFTRRLDAVVDFPVPEEPERLALWDACLGRRLPRADDIDLAFMARSFKLAGGAIRNIALTAAYFAAERGGPVRMEDLVVATQREYRKLGRLCLESEFGPYFELVANK